MSTAYDDVTLTKLEQAYRLTVAQFFLDRAPDQEATEAIASAILVVPCIEEKSADEIAACARPIVTKLVNSSVTLRLPLIL